VGLSPSAYARRSLAELVRQMPENGETAVSLFRLFFLIQLFFAKFRLDIFDCGQAFLQFLRKSFDESDFIASYTNRLIKIP